MKTKYIILISILASILFSCNNEEPAPKNEFIPGQVTLLMENNVTIDLTFNLINDANLEIESMLGFHYSSSLPTDSLDYVNAIMSEKTYFFDNSTIDEIVRLEDKIIIRTVFKKMNADSQSDWLNQIDRLKLTDSENDLKFLLINVEVGTEQEWIDKFNRNPLVKNADFNNIIRAN